MSTRLRSAVLIGCVMLTAVVHAQNEVLEQFQRKNTELVNANATIQQDRSELKSSLNEKERARIDPIGQAADRAMQSMDTLLERLSKLPADDTRSTSVVCSHQGTDVRVQEGLGDFFSLALEFLGSDSGATLVGKALEGLREPQAPETWTVRSFFHVPAALATTVLNKYRNDILRTEQFCYRKLFRERQP